MAASTLPMEIAVPFARSSVSSGSCCQTRSASSSSRKVCSSTRVMSGFFVIGSILLPTNSGGGQGNGGRMVDLAARTGCKGSPARTSVPNHDCREGISFRSGAPGWRCLALVHLRLLDEWPATATADTGIFRFIQGRPHDVGVVAGVFPIVADESEAGISVFPDLPVEVLSDDSPHPFPIHFRDEFLAIALQL